MSHDCTDITLTWMRANLPPKKWTLRRYVQINWMGDYTVAQVLESAELTSELPPELLRRFLKSGNAAGVPASTLAWIEELVEDSEQE
jgi:hypothetical protein